MINALLSLALSATLRAHVDFPLRCGGVERAAIVARNPSPEWAQMAAVFETPGADYVKYFNVSPGGQGVARIATGGDVYRVLVWVYTPGKVSVEKFESGCGQ